MFRHHRPSREAFTVSDKPGRSSCRRDRSLPRSWRLQRAMTKDMHVIIGGCTIKIISCAKIEFKAFGGESGVSQPRWGSKGNIGMVTELYSKTF